MDPENAAAMYKHLGKQNELLRDVHKKMSHELHTLQVEEEMLMRKFYELTSTLGLNKKSVASSFNEDDHESNKCGEVNTPSGEGQ